MKDLKLLLANEKNCSPNAIEIVSDNIVLKNELKVVDYKSDITFIVNNKTLSQKMNEMFEATDLHDKLQIAYEILEQCRHK